MRGFGIVKTGGCAFIREACGAFDIACIGLLVWCSDLSDTRVARDCRSQTEANAGDRRRPAEDLGGPNPGTGREFNPLGTGLHVPEGSSSGEGGMAEVAARRRGKRVGLPPW